MVDDLGLSQKGHHLTVSSASPEATMAIGEKLGMALKPGDVVCLYGEIGAGKTTLIKGIAKGLGVSEQEHVRSPTYAIVHQYRGRIALYHVDLYRLVSEEDLFELGYRDFFYPDGITVIEWAEKGLKYLPESRTDINIKIVGERQREMVLRFAAEDQYKKIGGALDL